MSDLKKAVAAFKNETFFKSGEYMTRTIPSEKDTLTYQLSIGEYTKFTMVWWVHPRSGMMYIEKYPVLESTPEHCEDVVALLNEYYRGEPLFRLVQIEENSFQVQRLYGGKFMVLDLRKPVDMAAEFKATEASSR